MKIKEAYIYAESKLNKTGIDGYKKDVEIIFSHLFNIGRTDLILKGNDELNEDDIIKLNEVLEKREKHIPIQEIFGETEFFGLKFKVNKDVLTPRPETELVLNEALNLLEGKTKLDILDLCTGSGILGISIKKTHPDFSVTISDISKEALMVAKENASINDVTLDIIESDMFKNITGKYDLIISNPPYIPESDRAELSKEVLEYDPDISLFGGKSGLDFYEIIGENVNSYLKDNGVLVLEIGYNQGNDVKDILLKRNIFKSIEVKKDYSDFERIVICKR